MAAPPTLPRADNFPQLAALGTEPIHIAPTLDAPATEKIDSFITFPPCQHLSKVFSSSAAPVVIKAYGKALKLCLLEPIQSNSTAKDTAKSSKEIAKARAIHRMRAQILRCKDCHSSSGIFLCLQCPNVGCVHSGHALAHSRTSGHSFGISLTGQMFCFKCQQYVGDPRLERARILQLQKGGQLSTYPGAPVFQCEHRASVEDTVLDNSRVPTFKASKGLKGFVNMGSTCFMSSILQAMVHNPYIRDYYLSGAHLDCPKSPQDCISCCVGQIFQDFYTSTSTTGYGPASLLAAAWKVKKSLAGYSEQDAHEFWQFLMQQLHKNDTTCTATGRDTEATPEPDSKGALGNNSRGSIAARDCDCITHRTFAGELQSTLTCVDCGNHRVTVDPMLDLSLEIQEKHEPLHSLEQCLHKFTNAEKLDILYDCPKCGHKTGVMKQLKIRQLPPTLCIQLKRFEHVSAQSSKIETHIEVPFMLDMSEYTLQGKVDARSCIYELYAVVYHIGSVNTGHYISMVKNRDGMWFKFDDANVVRVADKEVLSQQAYLLFYIVHEMP